MVKYKKGFQKDLHLQSDADMLHSHQSSKSDKDSSPIMLQAVAEKVKLAGKIHVITQERLAYAVYINIYLKACFWHGPTSTFCSIL